jgi:hypothetical protein
LCSLHLRVPDLGDTPPKTYHLGVSLGGPGGKTPTLCHVGPSMKDVIFCVFLCVLYVFSLCIFSWVASCYDSPMLVEIVRLKHLSSSLVIEIVLLDIGVDN